MPSRLELPESFPFEAPPSDGANVKFIVETVAKKTPTGWSFDVQSVDGNPLGATKQTSPEASQADVGLPMEEEVEMEAPVSIGPPEPKNKFAAMVMGKKEKPAPTDEAPMPEE